MIHLKGNHKYSRKWFCIQCTYLQANNLPDGEMSFQLMEGSGLPLAWHIRVTLEPSFTTISLDRLMILGGTVKENEICVNLMHRV